MCFFVEDNMCIHRVCVEGRQCETLLVAEPAWPIRRGGGGGLSAGDIFLLLVIRVLGMSWVGDTRHWALMYSLPSVSVGVGSRTPWEYENLRMLESLT